MRAVFFRKEPEINAKEVTIQKVITLPTGEYVEFTKNLLQDHDFLKENAELMGEKEGVWQCILVTGADVDEGVLVQSEGATYARYSSFVPSVKELIHQYQEMQKEQKEKMEQEICSYQQM